MTEVFASMNAINKDRRMMRAGETHDRITYRRRGTKVEVEFTALHCRFCSSDHSGRGVSGLDDREIDRDTTAASH